MKIAYVLALDVSRESGVLKKIVDQTSAWMRTGIEVKLFALSRNNRIWEGIGEVPVEVFPYESKPAALLKLQALVKRAIAWKPTAAYMRFWTYYPPLHALMAAVPTFLEINADDRREYALTLPWYRYLYHMATRRLIINSAAGLVCVTNEIAQRFLHYRKPVVVIGNGINLAQRPLLPAPKNSNPSLVFVGSPGHPWYGLEKVVWLARHFARWRFDLIGLGPADLSDGLSPNVIAHGPLGRREYEGVLAQADVGIGSLAFHVSGLSEGCNLKVREYLAYGIPTIIGHHDTDFPQPTPFLLELPCTPNNVVNNVAAVEQFVQAWRGKRVPREYIAHLDTYAKERQRISFFRRVLGIAQTQ